MLRHCSGPIMVSHIDKNWVFYVSYLRNQYPTFIRSDSLFERWTSWDHVPVINCLNSRWIFSHTPKWWAEPRPSIETKPYQLNHIIKSSDYYLVIFPQRLSSPPECYLVSSWRARYMWVVMWKDKDDHNNCPNSLSTQGNKIKSQQQKTRSVLIAFRPYLAFLLLLLNILRIAKLNIL